MTEGLAVATQVEVKGDPRMDVPREALQARFELMAQLEEKQAELEEIKRKIDELWADNKRMENNQENQD